MMRSSIIIPSLNSPIIDRIVRNVSNQEGFGSDDEIIVIGKDESRLLEKSARVQLVDTGRPVDASSARNIGIAKAQGDLLIFLDSDCMPQEGWFKEHLRANELGFEVVGGGVLPDGEGYWHLTYNLTMFHEIFSTATKGWRPFLPTLNLSISRHVIDQVGGLDVSLPYSHDVDWTTRMRQAGFYPYFWPAAAVQHLHNRHSVAHVWQDCAINGQYARRVRVAHQYTLQTPFFLRYRPLTLLLSPIIAAGVTGRIYARRWRTMRRHLSQLPAIFMTKLAWCWGAFRG